jgi:Fur family transcriptional regulator, ferric uptake regulator
MRKTGQPTTSTTNAAALLREANQRATPQRIAVLRAVAEAGCHVTAEAVYRKIAPAMPAITLSTVYRTLERLRDLRIISETDLGEGVRHFELVHSEPHHHLICIGCGAMIDLDDAAVSTLRDRVIADYGFAPHLDHLAIFGHCAACQVSSHA